MNEHTPPYDPINLPDRFSPEDIVRCRQLAYDVLYDDHAAYLIAEHGIWGAVLDAIGACHPFPEGLAQACLHPLNEWRSNG